MVSRVVMVPSRSKTAIVSSRWPELALSDGDRLDEDMEAGDVDIEQDPCDRAEHGHEADEPALGEQALHQLSDPGRGPGLRIVRPLGLAWREQRQPSPVPRRKCGTRSETWWVRLRLREGGDSWTSTFVDAARPW